MSGFPTERRRWRTVRRLSQLVRSPDPSLEELLVELEGYLPPLPAEADVTLAELHLQAFLPADDRTATVLRRRWG